MKTILTTICLAFALLAPFAQARADRHDRDYSRVREQFDDTKNDFQTVIEKRDRVGSNPHMDREFARAGYLFNHVRAELNYRDVPLGHISDELSDVRAIVDHLRDEYRNFGDRGYEGRHRVIEERRTYRWF